VIDELSFEGNIARAGKYGTGVVKRVQEWLTLHGFGLTIDDDFGPITGHQVESFQKLHAIPSTGVVNLPTWTRLVAPLTAALRPGPQGATLGATLALVAQQHYTEHPREVGGNNRGPWVRYYMRGADGTKQNWCAGCDTTLLAQASAPLLPPIGYHVNCDALADEARHASRLVLGSLGYAGVKEALGEGGLFLVRDRDGSYSHTGVITALHPDAFHTLEGNFGSGLGRMATYARSYQSCEFVRVNG